MAKKKAAKKAATTESKEVESTEAEVFDPFVGSEDDDLSDMAYVQDENTESHDTMPPETIEEAEALAEQEKPDGEEPKAEEKAEEKPAEQEAVPEEEVVEDKKKEVVEEDGDLTVPKDRFDEVNNERKDFKQKNKQLQDQLDAVVDEKVNEEPEPEPYDYAAQHKKAMAALLEGDEDTYVAINAEIREAEKAEHMRAAKEVANTGDEDSREQQAFEAEGTAIESQWPEFSLDAENYNAEARQDLLDLYVGYANSGNYSRSQALRKAATITAKNFGLSAKGEETADGDDPPNNVVDIKPTNIKEKTEAANKQPPVMEGDGEGNDSEPVMDIASMSDEEYESLPESKKRQIRGDIV